MQGEGGSRDRLPQALASKRSDMASSFLSFADLLKMDIDNHMHRSRATVTWPPTYRTSEHAHTSRPVC